MKRERDAEGPPHAPPNGYWQVAELPHVLKAHLDVIHQCDREYHAALRELVNLSEVFVAVSSGVEGAILPDGVTVEKVAERIAVVEQAVLQLATARLQSAKDLESATAERTKTFT